MRHCRARSPSQTDWPGRYVGSTRRNFSRVVLRPALHRGEHLDALLRARLGKTESASGHSWRLCKCSEGIGASWGILRECRWMPQPKGN